MMNFRRWLLVLIVVLALVVIFRPVFFKGGVHQRTSNIEELKIPHKNNTKVIIDTQAVNKTISEQSNPLAYSNDQTMQPKHPVLTKPEKTFSLQVGHFTELTNAEKFVKQLRQKGYRAYSQQAEKSYKVYVGPVLGKQNIQRLKQKLEKQIKQKSLIVEYSPIKDMP